MNLYDISTQHQELLDFINDDDFNELSVEDQHALIATKLNLDDDFKQRALSIAAFISNLDLEANALKVMEQRIATRRRANEIKVEGLKSYLLTTMSAMNIKDISNHQLRLVVRNNPCRVVFDDEDSIPAEFKEVISTIKISKSAIGERLKAGETVTGAHLEKSVRLDIK